MGGKERIQALVGMVVSLILSATTLTYLLWSHYGR